ncbi:MAG: hypothetical protein M3Q75_02020 [Gemmatimonadota bacterium]|nr:hypothetical protein [Gemmatimonadota bacterium]
MTYEVLAVDPGGEHCGMALFDTQASPQCLATWEETPGGCIEFIREWVGRDAKGKILVVEAWALYPWDADRLSFDEMHTSQLIGAIKLVLADYCVVPWTAKIGKQGGDVMGNMLYVEQQASIKKPMRQQLRARGIERVALGSGDHAENAELHGYHHIFTNRERYHNG